jgi:hypothetical protein
VVRRTTDETIQKALNPAGCVLELTIPTQEVANPFTLPAKPIARHTRPGNDETHH